MNFRIVRGVLLCLAATYGATVNANAYREAGKAVAVADTGLRVIPSRDWNRLDAKPGKYAETWTLDGEQLNDVTFYAGIPTGDPLVRERNKKREPLPKFTSATLLVEIPELLEGTYRAYRHVGSFSVTKSEPEPFLGSPGIRFSYEYTDEDRLPRKGEGRAAIVADKLYLATFDAPRLHYFERDISSYRALTKTAALTQSK